MIRNKNSPWNTKIYIIFAATTLLFLFNSIWEIKPVVVNITDFLGLTSHLTLTYWIGYILIVLLSIRLYLDKQIKYDSIYLIYLIVVGLFLFGVPIFAEENARFPWSYYPAGEVKTVLETKYIDAISKHDINTYSSWPATHIISAFILYLTGIKIVTLIKYMPLFWMLSVILITFCIGKGLKFSASQSFFSCFLVLSSFWTFHYYYGPQSLGLLIYLLLFMLIVIFGKKTQDVILICSTYAVIVITHMLTSIAFLSSFIFSSLIIKKIYEKRIKFIIFFSILFISWYIYLAPVMFKIGFQDFVKQATRSEVLGFFGTEKYNTGSLLTRQITHYSRLLYLMAYALSMIAATCFYLIGRIKEENKEKFTICFFWLIGILALFLLKYGRTEIDDRIYILSLVPTAYIFTSAFNRKILVILSLLFVIFHIPAHYGSESIDMLYSSELAGDKFFASKASLNSEDNILYRPSTGIKFYNNKIKFHSLPFRSLLNSSDHSALNNTKYVLFTKQFNNFMIYSYGLNLQDFDFTYGNLIYTSDDFNIYLMEFKKIGE